MFDDTFGQDFAEDRGSSASLDAAGFGDFTEAARCAAPLRAIAVTDLTPENMPVEEFGNSDPERLSDILRAIDHADNLTVMHVPMDMITQLYHQF